MILFSLNVRQTGEVECQGVLILISPSNIELKKWLLFGKIKEGTEQYMACHMLNGKKETVCVCVYVLIYVYNSVYTHPHTHM